MHNQFMEKNARTMLVKGLYNRAHSRNIILILTISVVMAFLCTSLGLSYGKTNAEMIKQIRKNGTTTVAWLENGTEGQAKVLTKLPYVRRIGYEKIAGILVEGNKTVGSCVYADQQTYIDFIRPVYGTVYGKYPQNSNEIMLSTRSLKELAIQNPIIGMRIDLELQWYGLQGADSCIRSYILTGYFEDYTESTKLPRVFVSKKLLTENDIQLYPQRILIDIKNQYLKGEQIERLLYEDMFLPKEEQYFEVVDIQPYRSMENLFGGYGIVLMTCGMILIILFFCIYNVMFISLRKDIDDYRLLKIVGVTNTQIMYLFLYQGIKIAFVGICWGGMIGSFSIFIGIPYLLHKMYIDDFGTMKDINVSHPAIWGVAALLSLTVAILAILFLVRNLNATLNNNEPSSRSAILQERKYIKWKMSAPLYLALHNLFRSKRKMYTTLITLVLGCEVAVCTSVILRGVDNINEIEKMPDFTIGLTKDAITDFPYATIQKVKEETILDYSLFKESDVSYIAQVADIMEKDIEKDYGCFARIDDVKESDYFSLPRKERPSRSGNGFEPIYNTNYALWDGTGAGYRGVGMVQVLSNDQMEQLGEYVTKKDINLDISKVERKNGTIIVHDNVLSQKGEILAQNITGTPLYLYPVYVLYELDDTYVEKGQLINCGYLNGSDELFPIKRNWKEKDILYFMISEQTFEEMYSFPKQIFQVRFDVDGVKEKEIKEILEVWIREKNINFHRTCSQRADLFYITCKSDIIFQKKSYIVGSKIILFCISAALIFIGCMNFFNTVVTDILIRKQELDLLKSIGMTHGQIKKMFRYEGLIYCLVVNMAVLVMGCPILWVIKGVMQNRVAYFRYSYPLVEYLVVILMPLLVSNIVPNITYNILRNESQ